jgi:muconolactone delta-isomerase
MGIFGGRRQPTDQVDSRVVADFGRFWLLKEESGLDSTRALQQMGPLRQLHFQPDGDRRTAEELRRHAAKGEWEAIGAWQFSSDFVQDDELELELTDLALFALMKMRITNLAIHLPFASIPRYEELTGGPAPDDKFWGPPAFDSHFGPSRADRESRAGGVA